MVQRPYSSTRARWVPYGHSVDVAGHGIPGGLIYVGTHLEGVMGQTEPALINPQLPVAPAGPAWGEAHSRAYHLLSPAARAAYLGWHAGGRRAEAPAGMVLLFCSGLERRVLQDRGEDPAATGELPAIAAEVRRLRERYGHGRPALSGQLDRFLDLLEVLAASRRPPIGGPDPGEVATSGAARGGPAPTAVRLALAGFAAAATPVPVEWARLWVRHHPLVPQRSAQTSCPDEFDRLFTARYGKHFGPGLLPPDDVPGVRIRYQPANPGLSTTLVCREDLPDVWAEPHSGRALGRLVDEIAAALEPYRRMVTQFPQGRGSLAATTLLPAELLDADSGRLGALRIWTEARFDGRALALVDGVQFAAFWSTASPGRMARDEAAAFIAVLALLGVGVEPDVRFGAPAFGPGPVVLFRAGDPAAAVAAGPGPGFAGAAAIARCAAAVVTALGPVEPHGAVWTRALATVVELGTACGLPATERTRLAARLGWLLTTGVDVDRLARQTARLDSAEREIAGTWLVSIAASVAPAFPPAIVAVLARLYRMLGLDLDLLFHRLHARSTGGPQRTGSGPQRTGGPPVRDRPGEPDEPVVVRAAEIHRGGFTLPWSGVSDAEQRPADAGRQPGDGDASDAEMRLDPAAISQKLRESAAVAALLTAIFDIDDGPVAATVPAAIDTADRIAGLDPAHSGLLRALTPRRSWTRDEFAALASAYGVLPDGALDVLNEAAIDTAGEALICDGATLTVYDDVLQELLR